MPEDTNTIEVPTDIATDAIASDYLLTIARLDPMHHVIYHAHCLDGFAAAFAFYRMLGNDPAKVTYHPVTHGDPLPQGIGENDAVAILDFCFTDDVMDQLLALTADVVVIDHHGTASATLQRLQEINSTCRVVFDRNKSGCVLAWEHCFGPKQLPWFFTWIQDRDLGYAWTRPAKCHPQIHTLYAGLWLATPRTFEEYDRLMAWPAPAAENQLLSWGRTAERARNIEINQILTSAHRVEIGAFRIPAVNSPIHQSELGHQLITRLPDKISLVWFITGPNAAHAKLSFRCTEGIPLHLGSWCRALWGPGAGGHAQAAGATIPLETFLAYPRLPL